MRVQGKAILTALIEDLRQRYVIQVLIDRMEHEPGTLADIGISFEDFAARQWQAHARTGALARLRRQPRRRTKRARIAGMVLPDTLGLHRSRRNA